MVSFLIFFSQLHLRLGHPQWWSKQIVVIVQSTSSILGRLARRERQVAVVVIVQQEHTAPVQQWTLGDAEGVGCGG